MARSTAATVGGDAGAARGLGSVGISGLWVFLILDAKTFIRIKTPSQSQHRRITSALCLQHKHIEITSTKE
jgi:hypothetical protein